MGFCAWNKTAEAGGGGGEFRGAGLLSGSRVRLPNELVTCAVTGQAKPPRQLQLIVSGMAEIRETTLQQAVHC